MAKIKGVQSYRITCKRKLDEECNYLSFDNASYRDNGYSFREVHDRNYAFVLAIKLRAKKLKIKHFWHHYEPYIEITWLGTRKQATKLFKYGKQLCKKCGVDDFKAEIGLKDYGGPDWFCKSDKECLAGAKIMSACSGIVEEMYYEQSAIERGYGVEAQVQRTIHRLCNPLGINYLDESKICFRQGWICFLWALNYKFPKIITAGVVRFIYNNVLRLKGRK